MILQEKLRSVDIVLGSKSPRRKELLASMDLDFEIEVRETDEIVDSNLSPLEVVKQIAKEKLAAFSEESYFDKLLICADTVVLDSDGKVLGKPSDLEEAKTVIGQLSNNLHYVYTAVALSYKDYQYSFVEETKVWFSDLSEEEISYYVEKYKPLDKAGSYGIQEWIGRIGIAKIEGSYENVIGLPTARLQEELKKIF